MSKAATASLQLSQGGGLRHLLQLRGLSRGFITELLDRAEFYQTPVGTPPARDTILEGRTVANLFFEPSTRTRASFELAARRLNADVLNLDVNMSSRAKGESLLDTIYTLQAMQVDIFVVRDASAGIPEYISGNVMPHVSVLNAGEADASHPTQGLLDLLTIRQNKGRLDGLTVTIIGDIAHSRVARSISEGLSIMGDNEIRLVAPEGLQPDMTLYPGAQFDHNIDVAIEGADVVMALRIQKERMSGTEGLISEDEYTEQFGLTAARLKLAKDDAIVMHPGPMNEGIEIDPEVAHGVRSVINQQVTNGVAVRMALLFGVVTPDRSALGQNTEGRSATQ
jgi:aspartate carbamoyltransferase catalytic subunit